MNAKQWDEYQENKGCNFAIAPEGIGRFRVNVYREQGNIALAIRYVVPEVPTISELGLPPIVKQIAGEERGRTEDSFIAYTWDKFLRTGDARWPARLPMTKSAVRAMDTVTSFCGTPDIGGLKVDQFVVSGGSKRGWTTWTTAAGT